MNVVQVLTRSLFLQQKAVPYIFISTEKPQERRPLNFAS